MRVLESLIRWDVTGWIEQYGQYELAIIARMGAFEYDFGQGSQVYLPFKTEFIETLTERIGPMSPVQPNTHFKIITRCSIMLPPYLVGARDQEIYAALTDDFDIIRWNHDLNIGPTLPMNEVELIDLRIINLTTYDPRTPLPPVEGGVMTTPMLKEPS
jgi:hypothetical protein